MPSPAIRVEHLSKRYALGVRSEGVARYDTFREALVRNLKRPFFRLRPSAVLRPPTSDSPSSDLSLSPSSDSPSSSVLSSGLRPPPSDSPSSPAPRAPAVLRPPSSVLSSSPSSSVLSSDLSPPSSEFWALRDVSFEIQRGEIVGIIGRNGAGKSTLLKILSRITEPTSGRVSVQGRLASLLEVGTGFHPELTGRENIFLNGVILGMTRAEVKKRFDEIVAFAETEQFLDTPVKHYSSGMYVRLAFAVAAHLEPEILVVDEVLAVGDAQFQQKCLQKMRSIASGDGKTILLVSHQLKTIEQLCSRCLLLSHGNLETDAPPQEAIHKYSVIGADLPTEIRHAILGNDLILTRLAVVAHDVKPTSRLQIHLELQATLDCEVFDIQLLIYNSMNERVALLDLRRAGRPYVVNPGASLKFEVDIPRIGLNEGYYSVGLCARTARFFKAQYDLISFNIAPAEPIRDVLPYPREYLGQVSIDFRFAISQES